MTLIVAFVTADPAVLETVAEKQTALLPAELRAKGFAALGGQEIIVTPFDSRISQKSEHLLAKLDWENADGVMVLTDGTMPGIVEDLGDQFSVHRFVPPAYGSKVANQLTSMLVKCLRAYRFLATRFDDRKYQQIFRLPLRNFDAPEIGRMRAACRDMVNRVNYAREIDAILADMRRRQKPKKASAYADTYLIDEDEKHFQLGFEHHSQAETGTPPHDALCILSNRLRFGRVFDGTTHYNVSREKAAMDGEYFDCHGTKRGGGKGSHLNMFTNDYF
jgi:hypothetical protein